MHDSYICNSCRRPFIPLRHNWVPGWGEDDLPICNRCLDAEEINTLTQQPHTDRRWGEKR